MREPRPADARPQHGVPQPGRLSVPQRVRDGVDAIVIEHLAIGAHHAHEPLAGEGARGGTTVGRGNRVILRGQLAAPQMDIAGERKPFGRDAGRATADRHGRRDRLGRRAQRSRVNQLTLAQAFGVIHARGPRHAARDGNDVRRGRAHVDEHAIGNQARHEERGRDPVRRGDRMRLAPGLGEREPARIHRPHPHALLHEGRGHGVEHKPHTLPLGAEQLRQLGRHRDGVRVARRGADVARQAAQQRRERGGITLQLVRRRPRRHHPPLRHTRALGVHSADVPAEDPRHCA